MPIKLLIMIASFPQFDLQSPHLHPIRALGIPELLHRNGSRVLSLIGSLEHRIHVLIRSEEKDTDVLLWHSTIEVQDTQHPWSELNGGDFQLQMAE